MTLKHKNAVNSSAYRKEGQKICTSTEKIIKEMEQMKQIISGKMYNTETAQEIGYDSNGMSRDDLWFVEETLYRKKNGEFFLDGHGGPLSRYSKPNGSLSRCGARELVPLSTEEAKAWVERHCSVEVYIEAFGNVSE